MNIGGKIRQLRRMKGIKQTDLASSIGVSLKTLQRWEDEKIERTPNSSKLSQIASALDTSVAYLMGINDGEQPKEIKEVPEHENNIGMAYWGGVVDNAREAVKSNVNLTTIYSLLNDALAIIKNAQKNVALTN